MSPEAKTKSKSRPGWTLTRRLILFALLGALAIWALAYSLLSRPRLASATPAPELVAIAPAITRDSAQPNDLAAAPLEI